jgi:hypothetical protein
LSTPPAAPDQIGPADLHTASITAIITSDVLLLLQHYVWHGQVPDQVAWTVYPLVSYGISQLSARLVRRRKLRNCQTP